MAISFDYKLVLRTELARACGVDVGEIDVDAQLAELGLDSIRIISVVDAIGIELGVTFEFFELAECVTVADLADALARATGDADVESKITEPV